jgi:hypothetical protein
VNPHTAVKVTGLRDFSNTKQANSVVNYTDRATAACRPTIIGQVQRGVTRSRVNPHTAVKVTGLPDLSHTKQTPWPESASELYRPSDRSVSAKLLSTFADRGSLESNPGPTGCEARKPTVRFLPLFAFCNDGQRMEGGGDF